MEEVEYWLAATKFHMTPAEWDECPAPLATWMLAIDDVFEDVKAKARRGR